jgi:hypothetical protein
LPGQDFDEGDVDEPPRRKKLDVMENRVAELQMDLSKEVKLTIPTTRCPCVV